VAHETNLGEEVTFLWVGFTASELTGLIQLANSGMATLTPEQAEVVRNIVFRIAHLEAETVPERAPWGAALAAFGLVFLAGGAGWLLWGLTVAAARWVNNL
jgi:hypothetical protein